MTMRSTEELRAMTDEQRVAYAAQWSEQMHSEVVRRSSDYLTNMAELEGEVISSDARDAYDAGVAAGFLQTLNVLRENGLLP